MRILTLFKQGPLSSRKKDLATIPLVLRNWLEVGASRIDGDA